MLYLQLAALRTNVYFDYVPSKANIADLPSRELFSELTLELSGLSTFPGSTHTLRIPAVAEWNLPLDYWLDKFERTSEPIVVSILILTG